MTYIFSCAVDPDTIVLSQGTHETRFKFNVFEFPVNDNDVYVACNATFCDAMDTSHTCRQVCQKGRAVTLPWSTGHIHSKGTFYYYELIEYFRIKSTLVSIIIL